MANTLNTFFHSVFNPKSLESFNKSPLPSTSSMPELSSIQLSEIEVVGVLRKLNSRKACGPDNIPNRLLIELADVIAPSLCEIFNMSLNLGGKSTTTQLLEVYHEILESVASGNEVDAIYLEFSKAFDKVPHHLLLRKLETLGIRGSLLSWFQSYLTDRQQRVVLHGVCSEWLPVTSDGCPVMFLFDNMNIHNGRPRYERLKRKVPPTMWNFTVRAVMKPDITGIDGMSAKSMDLTEQRPIKDLKAEDFFLDVTFPEFKEMTESNFDSYVEEQLYKRDSEDGSEETSESYYLIECVGIDQEYPESTKQTNVMVLPLSIEDESLTTGTASVLREFAKDLDITICKTDDHLTYKEHNKKIDINAARERYKFYEEMD
ncbi:Hypothetical predicted protein [Paramuricea clavata]|uniref:Uncharacterized protein n=1 Tax=Paramuricea clavata TaxID=317549 RepID=A0A7D9HRC3_PARCT|nr:Hypothetical predicted protein [Paramuricea clavata]